MSTEIYVEAVSLSGCIHRDDVFLLRAQDPMTASWHRQVHQPSPPQRGCKNVRGNNAETMHKVPVAAAHYGIVRENCRSVLLARMKDLRDSRRLTRFHVYPATSNSRIDSKTRQRLLAELADGENELSHTLVHETGGGRDAPASHDGHVIVP